MYPNSDEHETTKQDPVNELVNEPLGSDLIQNEANGSEPLSSGQAYHEPAISEQAYSEPSHSEPAYSEQPYSEPAYSEQAYSDPFYSRFYSEQAYINSNYSMPVSNGHTYGDAAHYHPMYNEQDYSQPREIPWNMYSPGICVDQPYPKTRHPESARSESSKKRGRNAGAFFRAVFLVLVCTMFSAAAAYFIMDFRFQRGDFTINNQVVLGGRPVDNPQGEDMTAPVATAPEGMLAQDIYDIARTQVVGVNTEPPDIFGKQDSQGGIAPVSGSGFIISHDGYILTNYHVIELAHVNELPLTVVMSDGTTYPAEVIGFEASSDVAIIKINATGLNPALIGNSDKIRVGQTIYAVGNPFGDLVYTMTDGIVSALDRVVSVDRKSINTFQFSAAVNSGNSGGPIYNTYGEVIGIVTAKVIRGNVEGIGFAIPINDAIEIATELIEHGYISGRPLIGITAQTVSSGHAEYYGWVVGAYVRSVSPDSAAEKAGIEVGDIITAIGEDEIDSMETLRFALRSYKAGDTTTITVWRNGVIIDLKITFDEDMYAGQPELRPVQEPDSPDPFEDFP